jgi:hypothetical protein
MDFTDAPLRGILNPTSKAHTQTPSRQGRARSHRLCADLLSGAFIGALSRPKPFFAIFSAVTRSIWPRARRPCTPGPSRPSSAAITGTPFQSSEAITGGLLHL